MSPLCAQKLARLQTIVAERATWADQLAQVKRLHGWLLEVEHLLDASPAQAGAAVSNATVGSRLDRWREQMATRLSDGLLSEQEREYLTEFLQVFSNLRPYLVQCYDREEFPRTNNGHGGQYRSAEARATAVSVAARTGTPRCCATGARSPITSGGSRMPPVDSNWSSGPQSLTGLAGERCVRRRLLPNMSNSRAFASVTSVRPYLLPWRHAGRRLLLLFCPDGFFDNQCT